MPRLLVMISGPYTSGARSSSERRENRLALNRAAYEVFRRGHVPLVGVNAALPIVEAIGDERFEEIMMPICLALADRCDAVLRVGGPSQGADEEVERVRAAGGHVYRSVDDLPDPTSTS
jgi:hypothetical protein